MRPGKEKPIVRPFCQSARVSCRSYSIPLQRIITDFGADVPFGRIPQKLQEHYGITVPVSSAQKITQEHAARVLQQHQTQTQIPSSQGVEQLIVEMDGSMIPRSRNRIEHCPRPENRPAPNPHSSGREKLAYVWLGRKIHLNLPLESHWAA